jgi:hypothetical protein
MLRSSCRESIAVSPDVGAPLVKDEMIAWLKSL